jgi:hypothetical protein
MTWLLPSALSLAAIAIVATIALHFISRSRPAAEALPTARFVPRRTLDARTRALSLTDLPLLLLRAAALAALGAAVAGPMFAPRGRVARVVVVDRSRAVASVDELRDTVRRLAGSQDALIEFDSVAVRAASLAAIDRTQLSGARGSLSSAIAAGIRAGVGAAASTDSVELVLVSPLVREEMDEATARVRAAWPGRIRVVPVRAATADTTPLRVAASEREQDAIVAGLALAGASAPGGRVRLVRGRVSATDSIWAKGAGHVLLHWPAADSAAVWARRATIDAIGGVTSSAALAPATLVARFPRLWVLTGQAVARWSDGEPAAVEHTTGEGCIRDVGVLVDEASDLTLRPAFRRFARALLAPCGGPRDFAALGPGVRTSLAGTGPLAASSALRDHTADVSRWSPWLLGLAALFLIAELAMRHAGGRAKQVA